jgi:hypothetical protein
VCRHAILKVSNPRASNGRLSPLVFRRVLGLFEAIVSLLNLELGLASKLPKSMFEGSLVIADQMAITLYRV